MAEDTEFHEVATMAGFPVADELSSISTPVVTPVVKAKAGEVLLTHVGPSSSLIDPTTGFEFLQGQSVPVKRVDADRLTTMYPQGFVVTESDG